VFLFSDIRATCPAHLILLDFITKIHDTPAEFWSPNERGMYS
jgi:hypothetical protein